MSPVEVVQASVDRIQARNDTLNTFVHKGFDEALERAWRGNYDIPANRSLG
ncbi:MAG: hypothetical protein KY434_00740 [Actinobacteria bacterium]|nr:hypothetical protein [Actinomycetota bacterium]